MRPGTSLDNPLPRADGGRTAARPRTFERRRRAAPPESGHALRPSVRPPSGWSSEIPRRHSGILGRHPRAAEGVLSTDLSTDFSTPFTPVRAAPFGTRAAPHHGREVAWVGRSPEVRSRAGHGDAPGARSGGVGSFERTRISETRDGRRMRVGGVYQAPPRVARRISEVTMRREALRTRVGKHRQSVAQVEQMCVARRHGVVPPGMPGWLESERDVHPGNTTRARRSLS